MRLMLEADLNFLKMHGLGNDFVVLDARLQPVSMTPDLAERIADRHRGVGCDQLAIISDGPEYTHLTFYNADGSLSGACGNATRCIADMLLAEMGAAEMALRTDHALLQARRSEAGVTSVNMGPPQLDWQAIPLASDVDTLHLPINGDPVATGMGNPHCTFFVEDAEAVDLMQFGPAHEHHPLYPKRTNVQVAQLIGPDRLRMRVWERGAGITLASGSSSCATAVAAARRGLTSRHVEIVLDGGVLDIDWRDDGVWMTGPTAHVFSGTFTQSFLGA